MKKRKRFVTILLLLACNQIFQAQTVLTLSDVTFDETTGTITAYSGSATDIEIPASFNVGGEDVAVTAIGGNAFTNKGLTTVVIPNSVTSIGNYAFQLNSLTSVDIPNNVTEIGMAAFMYNSIASLTIGSGLTSIGFLVFANNSLTSVTIPNSVIEIGQSAFEDNSITSITIPNSVTQIGPESFNRNAITEINGEPSNGLIYARNEDGTDDLNKIVSYGGVASVIDFIPQSVTTIGNSTFNNSSITSLVLPNGVTSIGASAFKQNSLTSINIPESVTSIGALAFNDNMIAEVNGEPSDGLIYARNNDGSDDFSTLVSYGGIATDINFIPNTVTTINKWTFQYSSINSVILPNNLNYIGAAVFQGNSISSVIIPSNTKVIGGAAFQGNAITSLDIPNGVDTIASHAFATNQLTDVTISNSVVCVDEGAFSFNLNLAPITLPTTIQEGYSSKEWYTAKDFSGGTIDQITTANYTSGFYVKQDPIIYNINYNIVDESDTIGLSLPLSYTIETNNMKLADAQKEGHVFSGWFTQAEGGEKVTSIAKGSMGDTTLYAQWDIIENIDVIENKMRIYPNPSNGIININSDFSLKNATISVMNLGGNIVQSKKITSNIEQVDLSKQPAGTYFVKLVSDQSVKIEKIILK